MQIQNDITAYTEITPYHKIQPQISNQRKKYATHSQPTKYTAKL